MVIRKISIGTDYKSSMNYIVGQNALNNTHTIFDIIEGDESIAIWIANQKQEVVRWKKISKTTPHTIEYNINI
tara:strand:+ start:512 stop:730 length:219 start_codon:yes stop_codon:yes gene_type:complete